MPVCGNFTKAGKCACVGLQCMSTAVHAGAVGVGLNVEAWRVHITDNTCSIPHRYVANSRSQPYRMSISNILTDKHPDWGSLTCVHKVHWSVYSCFRFLAPRCILQSHMWLQDGTAELHVNSNGIWHVRLHCSNYSVQCVKGTGNP